MEFVHLSFWKKILLVKINFGPIRLFLPLKIQKQINNKFTSEIMSLFQKHVFIFKMGFRMCFHFQNVVLFWNVLSFSKCERFCECCFSFFQKTQLLTKICTFTTNSFTDEVVNKQQNMYICIKLLNLFQLSRIYNLL